MTIRGSTTETRLARSAGPMPEVGHLVVDIHFGVAHHRIEGPMGLYPRGVVEIVKAVQAAVRNAIDAIVALQNTIRNIKGVKPS